MARNSKTTRLIELGYRKEVAFVLSQAQRANEQGVTADVFVDRACQRFSVVLGADERHIIRQRVYYEAKKIGYEIKRAEKYKGTLSDRLQTYVSELKIDAPAKTLEELAKDFYAQAADIDTKYAPEQEGFGLLVQAVRVAATKIGYVFMPARVADRIRLVIARAVEAQERPLTAAEIAERVGKFDRVSRNDRARKLLTEQVYDVAKGADYTLHPMDRVRVQGSVHSRAIKQIRILQRADENGLTSIEIAQRMLGDVSIETLKPREKISLLNAVREAAHNKGYEIAEIQTVNKRVRSVIAKAIAAGAELSAADIFTAVMKGEKGEPSVTRQHTIRKAVYEIAKQEGFSITPPQTHAAAIRDVISQALFKNEPPLSASEIAQRACQKHGWEYTGDAAEAFLHSVYSVATLQQYQLKPFERSGRRRIKIPSFIGVKRPTDLIILQIAQLSDYLGSYRVKKTAGLCIDIQKYKPYGRQFLPETLKRSMKDFGFLEFNDGKWVLTSKFVKAWENDGLLEWARPHLQAYEKTRRRELAHLNRIYCKKASGKFQRPIKVREPFSTDTTNEY